jgi:predicted ATPase
MDERQPFGAVLKRFRVAAGLTHEALAERAGLGARTISDLERGVSRAPRADTLALLVEALGLTPEQRARLEAAVRPGPDAAAAAPAPPSPPSNLPVELTSFVGREQEARAVRGLLQRGDTRLVTLTGPGGVGKTRLAFHVAAQTLSEFADGVVAVPLAPVVDREGAVTAIRRALGRDEQGRGSLADTIAELAGKELLLLLDNCEHLADAAPIVAELLRGCTRLRILTTSRASLRVSGEQEFAVSPLPVPDPTRLPTMAALADYAAVALFVDRAKRIRPEFALTPDNAAAVATICARLDGLPLAVELAAARVKALPPRVLAERLGDATGGGSLRLLTGGARDVAERHQTLRDTIAWSHDLLSPAEQTLFRRLAVFAGGCVLEAAEHVAEGLGARGWGLAETDSPSPYPLAPIPPSVLDGLASLVDKSLLVQEDGPEGEARYVMLETIRAYAWERLTASGEEAALRRRHAAYYLALVEATGGLLFAGARKRARLAAEQGNVQAALRWLVQHG